jgi:ferric-dicitrate binding protein FerR (iron transport regulator)
MRSLCIAISNTTESMISLKVKVYLLLLTSMVMFASCSEVRVTTHDGFEVVDLPDGSIASLNRNSSIAYNPDFNERTVDVEGEVFFSVEDDGSPFIVRTDLGEVKVLGTDFNVKAGADQIEVEVEEGIVELKSAKFSNKIKRGEAAVFSAVNQEIRTARAEFKFRLWMNDLRREFKKLGKDIKTHSKEAGKESRKAGKQLKQELKKLKGN